MLDTTRYELVIQRRYWERTKIFNTQASIMI